MGLTLIEREMKNIKRWDEPGLNQRPCELQSHALPTELSSHYVISDVKFEYIEGNLELLYTVPSKT